jgi:hypothetical protein
MKRLVKRFTTFNAFNYMEDYKEKRGKFMVTTLRKMSPDKIIKEEGSVKGSHPYLKFVQVFYRLCKVFSGLGKGIYGGRVNVPPHWR